MNWVVPSNKRQFKVLFNPGFDTNAFLVDFLRYYGSRPPHARNAIYEG